MFAQEYAFSCELFAFNSKIRPLGYLLLSPQINSPKELLGTPVEFLINAII